VDDMLAPLYQIVPESVFLRLVDDEWPSSGYGEGPPPSFRIQKPGAALSVTNG
jgi:hypothetical protein